MNKLMIIPACFLLSVFTVLAAEPATNTAPDKAKAEAEAKRMKAEWEAKAKAEAEAQHKAEREAKRKAEQERRRIQSEEWKSNDLSNKKKYAEAKEAYLQLAADEWLMSQKDESAMARYRLLSAKSEALATGNKFTPLRDAFYAEKDKLSAGHLADAAQILNGAWNPQSSVSPWSEELNQVYQIAFDRCKAENVFPGWRFFASWCSNLYYTRHIEKAEEVADWAYNQLLADPEKYEAQYQYFVKDCYINMLTYASREKEITPNLLKLRDALKQVNRNQWVQNYLEERAVDHMPKADQIAYHRKKGDLLRATELEGGIEAKRKVAAQMLENPTLMLKERIPAMAVFMHDVVVDPGIYHWRSYVPQALKLNHEMRTKYLQEFVADKDVKVEQLIHDAEINTCMWYEMHDSVIDLLEPFYKAEKGIKDADIMSLGVSYCAVGRLADSVKVYESIANSKRGSAIRFKAAMTAKVLQSTTKDQILSAYKELRKQFAEDKAVNDRSAIDALRYAGNVLVIAGLNEQAHALLDADECMIVKLPTRTYTVKYSAKPIHSVAEILAAKPEVQLLDRKFGSNKYEFMTTDVSTGRIVAEQDKNAKKRPAEFMAVCDELGFHLLFHCFDDRGIGLETGNISAGGFEMYMAPGPNQPYTCFLTDNGKGTVDLWNTTYNNEHYRRLTQNDPRDFYLHREFTQDGYYMHFFFAWKNYYDTLPVDKGDFYEFENAFWAPGGAQSWSGLALVHSRSTWGRLYFDIAPDQAVRIKRNILMAALPYYNREAWSNRANHGVYHMWDDPELGDPEFYASTLLTLRKQLDAARDKIKADMSDDDVNAVYRDAIHGIREIRTKAEQLRADYLMEKFSEK